MTYLMEIDNLGKHYDDFELSGVSLAVEPDCVVGVIGSNGAGKTKMCIRDRVTCFSKRFVPQWIVFQTLPIAISCTKRASKATAMRNILADIVK